jgi:hypothetical protein
MKTNPSGPDGGVRKRPARRLAGRAALAAVLLGSIGALATAASATSSAKPVIHAGTLTAPAGTKYTGPLVARTTVLPYRNAPSRQQLNHESSNSSTVATFSAAVHANQNNTNYGFTIVGGNFTAGAGATTITTNIIPVIVHDNTTGDNFDPTVANGGCGETVSPVAGMLNGPLLNNRRWYQGSTYVGTGDYTDALMRESFWDWVYPGGPSPNYHLRLAPDYEVNLGVSFSGATEINHGTCNVLLEFPLSSWDSFIQGFINSGAFAAHGVNTTTFPVFLFKNVVFTGSGCCVLGYHSAFNVSAGTQTYGNADYVTDGEFGASNDQAVASHEIGEWAMDPFVNNGTPAWGHIGQVSGCQGNLEVGDPLTGTVFPVNGNTRPGSNNPTYHMQELALFGWFFDENYGVNSTYSTRGTFGSGATLCS